MKSETLIILGAGGHGKVVADCVSLTAYKKVVFFDENPNLKDTDLFGFSIINSLSELKAEKQTFHIAIGDNNVRFEWLQKLKSNNKALQSVKHPEAILSHHASLDEGVFLAALSIVGPSATISAATIINHHAVIDHDCVIGKACHIAPSATLGGNVTVGDRVFIGANATILPGITIGSDVVVGAGSVVTKNIDANSIVVGIPAKAHQKMEEYIE